MRSRTRRLYAVGIAGALVLAGAGLAALALGRHADLFYTPMLLAERGQPAFGKQIRVGGYVEVGSLTYGEGAEMRFVVGDGSGEVLNVQFIGIAPDLFREGQGVVATGAFVQDDPEVFHAEQLLAKHDENYQPRELKQIGLQAGP
ncbi:MAG: cytochrome c maturation protein CcmE [Pseudomonadota bacterium]